MLTLNLRDQNNSSLAHSETEELDRITKLLSESDAATLGRRLAVLDDKIRGAKVRRSLIVQDAESHLEELKIEADQVVQNARMRLKTERENVRKLSAERDEIISALLTNVARVAPPAESRVVRTVIFDPLNTTPPDERRTRED